MNLKTLLKVGLEEYMKTKKIIALIISIIVVIGGILMLWFLNNKSKIGEGLSIHYSGGSSLSRDISNWLSKNGISER